MEKPKTTSQQPTIVVAALYHFAPIEPASFRDALKILCEQHEVYGTLILASEGINGTIASSRRGIDAVITFLRAQPKLARLEWKESTAAEMPFHRLKVRTKKEIVTMGVEGVTPSQQTGIHVDAKQWNELISDPEVLLIDTRNHYECEIGTFEGAISPETESFRQFPDFVRDQLNPSRHKKVAMFCTGGIRCEKASAYMLEQGFDEVYQLKGGILKYLEEVPEGESRWKGDCFVFDGRVSLRHGLETGDFQICYGCRMPLWPRDLASPLFEAGVCCPRCAGSLTEERRAALEERNRQIQFARERDEPHLAATHHKPSTASLPSLARSHQELKTTT